MKKLPEIFIFETLAPIFVVLFHVNVMAIPDAYFRYDSYIVLFLTSRLVSFIVAGFIFMSGLKLTRKYANTKFNYPSFLLSRFVKIYLPYLFWAILYYIYFVYNGWREFSWSQLPIDLLTGRFIDHLYFVGAIMQFYVLFPLFLIFCKRTTPRLGILLALPITIAARIYLDTAIVFLPHILFFVAGCYVGLQYERFVAWLKKSKGFIYPAYFVATGAHLFLLFLDITGRFEYQYRETITVFFCIFSILVFHHICLCANKSPKKREHGGFLSRNLSLASYYVYLAHVIVLYEAHRLLTHHFEIFDPMQRYLIVMAAGVIIPYALFLPYAKIKIAMRRK